jgi:hypothetical protein
MYHEEGRDVSAQIFVIFTCTTKYQSGTHESETKNKGISVCLPLVQSLFSVLYVHISTTKYSITKQLQTPHASIIMQSNLIKVTNQLLGLLSQPPRV